MLEREVRGEYSRIPLRIMRDAAVEAGVLFKAMDEEDILLELPDELRPIHEVLSKRLPLNDVQLSWLRQQYLHHSHHWLALLAKTPEEGVNSVVWQAFYPMRPAENYERIRHRNEP